MDNELEQALMLSRETYALELDLQLKSGIDLNLQIQPLNELLELYSIKIPQYKEYCEFSDIIILPYTYIDKLKLYLSKLDNNKPIILDCLGLKFTVLDFQNATHFAYISMNYYKQLKQLLFIDDISNSSDYISNSSDYISNSSDYISNSSLDNNTNINITHNIQDELRIEDEVETENKMQTEDEDEMQTEDDDWFEDGDKYVDKSIRCIKCSFTTVNLDYNIKKIILEPLNPEFLETKNQLELFENNIGKLYRVLSTNQVIYSRDKEQLFNVKKIIFNETEEGNSDDNNDDNNDDLSLNGGDSMDIIGYCVDIDIIIDFFIPEDKLKIWERELKEKEEDIIKSRKKKLEELNNITYNGNVLGSSNVLGSNVLGSSNVLGGSNIVSNNKDESITLSKEELRNIRLSRFNKL